MLDNTKLKAGAGAAEIEADDSMVIAGGIQPSFLTGQEGKLRVCAIVIEKNIKICIIVCDVIMIKRDILDDVCKKIEAELNIPFENILISATHTHHAPSTIASHGHKGEELFCERLKDAITSAVTNANENLKRTKCSFSLGRESTVGRNSRVILDDGTVLWIPLIPDNAFLRPTGPFDCDLPILAFKRDDRSLEALLFNHSTHNIGSLEKKRSPGFYGLAAQELEQQLGGTVVFAPGAAGSTHDFAISTDEKVFRIKDAVKHALDKAEDKEISGIISLKKEFSYRIRKFDEDVEDKAVSDYCEKLDVSDCGDSKDIIEVFRNARQSFASHQGKVRKSWLHIMLIGEIAFVGVPGEFFGELGIEIKRRSPFRYTYIIELANDCIGYIPDEEAYTIGGYQVWTGLHSFVEKGTGEAIVEDAVQLLYEIKAKL